MLATRGNLPEAPCSSGKCAVIVAEELTEIPRLGRCSTATEADFVVGPTCIVYSRRQQRGGGRREGQDTASVCSVPKEPCSRPFSSMLKVPAAGTFESTSFAHETPPDFPDAIDGKTSNAVPDGRFTGTPWKYVG